MNSVVFMGCHDKSVWLCPSIKATNTGKRQERGEWRGWHGGVGVTAPGHPEAQAALRASISQRAFPAHGHPTASAGTELHL